MKKFKKPGSLLCTLLLLLMIMGPAYAESSQDNMAETPLPTPTLTADVSVSERVVPGTTDTYDVTVSMTPKNASYSSTTTDENSKADVVFLVDTSYSMEGEKIENLRASASQFASSLLQSGNDAVRVSIINFDSQDQSTVRIPLSSNLSEVQAAINGLVPHGLTYLQPGLANAQSQFDVNGRAEAQKVIVVLGDGTVSDKKDAKNSMEAMKQAYPGLTIKTIGYKISSYTETFFRELAQIDTENGQYYNADTDNLDDIFSDISQQVVTMQVNIKKLTAACPKPENFDIVPGSLVNPDGLIFDMNQFDAGIIQAEIITPQSGVPLTFSYQIKIDPVKAAQNREEIGNELNYDFKYFYNQSGTEQTGAVADRGLAPVFYIDTEADENGLIDAAQIVGKGADVSVAWSPNEGYSLSSALLDGTELGNLFSNEFSDVSENHILKVTFVKTVPPVVPTITPQKPAPSPETPQQEEVSDSTPATPATGLSNHYSLPAISAVFILIVTAVIATRLKHKANR